MTPQEFKEMVQKIIETYDHDLEYKHIKLDELMYHILIDLGYEDGVELIKKTSLWFA